MSLGWLSFGCDMKKLVKATVHTDVLKHFPVEWDQSMVPVVFAEARLLKEFESSLSSKYYTHRIDIELCQAIIALFDFILSLTDTVTDHVRGFTCLECHFTHLSLYCDGGTFHFEGCLTETRVCG